MSIDQPVVFLLPFIHDANTAFVVWTCEVILQVHGLGCRLVPRGVGTSHLGSNLTGSFSAVPPHHYPEHKCAGTIALVVFER
jgi:hypothetical protein